jgi:O-acetylhomoserine (thiol)-lyase
LLVDSTLTTPYLLRPFEWGADLVFHSATKFLGGHGTVIGGLVVDSGAFDWVASGKFPTLSEPYAGFHGMNFAEESTVGAFLLRARREGLRDFGACLSPSAFQILQGLKSCRCAWRAISTAPARSSHLAGQPKMAPSGASFPTCLITRSCLGEKAAAARQ